MIEIKCSKQEKRCILKALHESRICPFDALCTEQPNGTFDYDHDKCREHNIKWIITDEQKEKPTLNMDEVRSFSMDDVARAGAKAIAEMIAQNPTCVLIHEEFETLVAKTIANLFDKED